MAIVNNPNIKIVVTGDNITGYNNNFSFVLEDKVEESTTISATTGPFTLNYSNITNAKLLIIYGNGVFTINVTTSDGTFVLPNDGTIPTVLNLTQDFLDSLISITLDTDSTTNVQVFSNIYGIPESA